MNTSASMMARPILAALTYSPPITGTSMSSVPLSPSPMMIWHPVDRGEKPFSMAASRCSRAFFRRPAYRVLQSDRKGTPPWSFTKSATTLAQLGRRKVRLPGSPKCILMHTSLPSKSISPAPARSMSLRSLVSWLVPMGTRKSVKYTFEGVIFSLLLPSFGLRHPVRIAGSGRR